MPGDPSPGPLPMPETPVGGERMASCDAVLPPGAPVPPAEVDAGTWVVADVDSGEVVAAKDPHGRHRPASTIKVLTALVAIRELDLDEPLVATQQDADQEGSKVGLVPGVPYTVRQVVTGMLMQSGNDAAHALANRLGGMRSTVTKMNELAAHLGARDTRVASPSGLDGPGMSTSAYDLALIFRTGMGHPEFAQAVATRTFELPGSPGAPPTRISSDNAVLRNYPGAFGGKTGFTDDARHTFIGAAERDGRRLVAVLLRGENKPVRLSAQTTSLLDYGFGLRAAGVVGELVPEHTAEPKAPPPNPRPAPPATANAEGGSTSIGAPLTVLAVAVAAVVGVFAYGRSRTSPTAARDDSDDASDEHP